MSCTVPYIRSAYSGHPELIDRLEQINSDIWSRINHSKLFREYGNERLFSKPGTEQYKKQIALVRQINQDYRAPKSVILKVPTKSGYNNKVVVSLHPIAQQVWFETEAYHKMMEDMAIGITPQGDSDTNLLGSPTRVYNAKDTFLREKYFSGGDKTTVQDILQKISESSHPLAPLAKTLLQYNIVNPEVELVRKPFITTPDPVDPKKSMYAAGVYHAHGGNIQIAEYADFKGEGSEVTLLHEIIHSLSYHFLNSNDPIAKDFKDLFEKVKANYSDRIQDKYHLTNVHEFITGIFTNGSFVKDLTNLPPVEGAQYKNLWEQLLDFFRSLFNIPEKQQTLFDQAFAIGTHVIDANTNMDQIFKEFSNIPNEAFFANPTRTGYSQEAPEPEQVKKPEEISDSLITRSNSMELKEVDHKDEDGVVSKQPRYFVQGKEIAKRVSDSVKKLYKKILGNREMEPNEARDAINEIVREKGSQGHKDFQHAITLMIDPATHKLVTKEQYNENIKSDDKYTPLIGDNRIYTLLRDNLWDRLHTYDPDSIFLSEIGVYNTNRAGKNSSIGGTMDLVVLEPDQTLGTKVNILDWKFINLNTEYYNDVPWYKIQAWRLQMEIYKQILKEAYGVKEEQFAQTRMIPIVAKYDKGYDQNTGKYTAQLTDIHIGDVDPHNISDDYLLPVVTKGETTGDAQIDKLLASLNALYDQISNQKVDPEQRREKADRLNNLFTAIRHLQLKQDITPLLQEVNTANGTLQNLISEYKEKYDSKEIIDIPDKDISDFVNRIITLDQALDLFSELNSYLKGIRDNITDEDLKNRIDEGVLSSQYNRRNLDEMLKSFVANNIAGRYGYHDLLSPEAIVKGLPKIFNSTATIQMESMRALYSIVNRIKNQADKEADEQIEKVKPIFKAYEDWATKKGLSKKDYFSSIKAKGENKLLSQYKKEFYNTLKSKIAAGDTKWVRENIDTSAYKTYLEEELKKEIEALKVSPKYGLNADGTPEDNSEREEAIIATKKRMNFNNPDSFAWRDVKSLRQFPLSKWESDEYKELMKPSNSPARALYEYIRERNLYYASIGYISKAEARTFLPYIRSGIVERIMAGNKVSLTREFLNSISIDETTVGYGKVDPLTGEILREIPTYFTHALPQGEESNDVFSNLILLDHSAIRYKMLSDAEGQVKGLLRVEAAKNHLNSRGEEEAGNDNAKLLKAHADALIYGKAYVDADALGGTLKTATKVFEKINKFLGFKMYPTDINPERRISAVRSVDAITKFFYMQQLNNLNIVSPLSNLFGGSLQTFINAGDLFSGADYARNFGSLGMAMMNFGEKAKMRRLAADYFMFTTESTHKIKAAQLSYSKLNPHNMQEWTGGLIGKSDRYVQITTGLSLLDNTIVMNGKLMNVNDYVHSQKWYRERYNNPSTIKEVERRAIKEIASLKNSNSVWDNMEIINDKLSIKGVERGDSSVQEIRRLAMAISQRALGNISEDQTRLSSIIPVVKGMMVFKNWIPGIVEARTGALKYNAASQAYEWGRLQTWWKFGGTHFFTRLTSLIDALNTTPKSIEQMRELYEKQRDTYRKKYGKELNLTFQEFADLTRSNLRAQAKDFLAVSMAVSLLILAKAIAPDDDDEDPRIKAYHNFILRTLDKLQDEATFYYNPVEFEQIVAGKVFPAASTLTDGFKAMQSFMEEMYGLTFQNNKMVESAKPTKYIMRLFPFAKQMTDMLPLFAPSAAKEWGVRINPTHNIE